MKISEIRKNLKFSQLIYPLVLLSVFAFTGLAVFRTAVFSKKIIDGVFLNDGVNSSQLTHVDLVGFKMVAGKLGYELPEKKLRFQDNVIPSSTAEIVAPSILDGATSTLESTSSTEMVAISTEPTISKSSLKVMIYNASGKKGAAAAFAERLTNVGFINVSTGNTKVNQTDTVINIKNEFNSLLGEVQAIFGTSSNAVVGEFLASTSTEDLIITIGRN